MAYVDANNPRVRVVWEHAQEPNPGAYHRLLDIIFREHPTPSLSHTPDPEHGDQDSATGNIGPTKKTLADADTSTRA